MNAALIADSIVNFCGAVGLCVAIVTFHRRDPRGMTTFVLNFALGVAALLFVLRGLAWSTGSDFFDRASIACASVFPLGMLLATEIIMRRHAPRALKQVAFGGTLLLLFGVFSGLDRIGEAYYVLLPAFQVGMVGACVVLLMRGKDDDLSAAERNTILRIGWAIMIAAPFVLTDFRSFFPTAPVRIGALGALLAITFLIADGGGGAKRQSFALLVLRATAALALGAATSLLSPTPALADVARFCAVAVSGVLAIGLTIDAMRDYLAARAPGILVSLADTPAQTRTDLIAALRAHPIFENPQRLGARQLVEFDPDILAPALAARPVWRMIDRPWGLPSTDPGVERIASLMTTCNATHLVVMQTDPLDLLAVAVPMIAADPATETALQLLRRALANCPQEAA